MLDIFTVIISVSAIIIAYLSLISKKPRIYFKYDSIYKKNTNSHLLNLCILNCGDKPAFDIKITPNNDIENHIDTNIKTIEEKFRNLYNLISYDDCFKHITKIISGGSNNVIYIGEIGEKKGNIKNDFKIDAEILFYEEFILYKNIHIFLCFFDYVIVKLMRFKITKYLNCLTDNSIDIESIKILGINSLINLFSYCHNYKYSKIKKIHTYNYEYSFNDMNIAQAVQKDNFYNNCKVLFDDHLYKIWENTLTSSERKIFYKHKLNYMYDIEKYISLIYEIDKEKNRCFYNKYLNLLNIMLKIEFLDHVKIKKLEDVINEHTNK